MILLILVEVLADLALAQDGFLVDPPPIQIQPVPLPWPPRGPTRPTHPVQPTHPIGCFVGGQCEDSLYVDYATVASAEECLEVCKVYCEKRLLSFDDG